MRMHRQVHRAALVVSSPSLERPKEPPALPSGRCDTGEHLGSQSNIPVRASATGSLRLRRCPIAARARRIVVRQNLPLDSALPPLPLCTHSGRLYQPTPCTFIGQNYGLEHFQPITARSSAKFNAPLFFPKLPCEQDQTFYTEALAVGTYRREKRRAHAFPAALPPARRPPPVRLPSPSVARSPPGSRARRRRSCRRPPPPPHACSSGRALV